MAAGDIRRLFARRLPFSAEDQANSICLDEAMGYLAVEVTFLGEPVAKIDLEFFEIDPMAEIPTFGDSVAEMVTDDNGRAVYQFLRGVGLYACRISGQEPALITTVEDPAKPFVIPLPVGRPYFDHLSTS